MRGETMIKTCRSLGRCALAIATIGAAVAGCGDNGNVVDAAVVRDAGVVVDAQPIADAGIALTDAQIAGLGLSGNNAAIQEGQLAQTKTTNSQVLAFANQQVTQHTAANTAGAQILGQLGIVPAASPASQAVDAQTQTTLNTLTPLTGTAFDSAYLQSQVTLNQQIVSTTNAILPTMTNQQLKTLVQQTQTAATQNAAAAQQLLTTL